MGYTTQDAFSTQQLVYMPQPLYGRKRDRSGSVTYPDLATSDPWSKPSKRPCLSFHATIGFSYNEDMDVTSDTPLSIQASCSTNLEPLDIGITIPASFTPAPTKARYDSYAVYTAPNEPSVGFRSADPYTSSGQTFPQSLLWKTGPSQPEVVQPIHSRSEKNHPPHRSRQIPHMQHRPSCTAGGGMPCLIHPHRTCPPHMGQWTPRQVISIPPLASWLSSS